MATAPRILLSTIYQPFERSSSGDDLLDPYSSRFGKEQGVFCHEGFVPYLAIHLIARNISACTTVLDAPTLGEFIAAIKEPFDFIGIGFHNRNVEQLMHMLRLVREHNPKAKTIIGGYGVMCFGEYIKEQPEMAGLVDMLCEGEGISFFRQLLGEPQDAPIDFTMPLNWIYPFRLKALGMPIGAILVGLGCKQKCEFCCTAAFFPKHIQLATGQDIYHTMVSYLLAYPRLQHISLWDENVLAHPGILQDLKECLRKTPTMLSRISIQMLATVEKMAELDPAELVAMGVSTVWIGVESKFAVFPKVRDLDVQSIFKRLKEHGISTIASFMIGLDEQTPENIAEDLETLSSLEPTQIQIAKLTPGPGTVLWDRLKREGRLSFKGWQEQHMYGENITSLHFQPGEIDTWIKTGNRLLFERHGSSVLRLTEVMLCGYRALKGKTEDVLQERRAFYEKTCRKMRIGILPQVIVAPNNAVRRKALGLLRDYREEFGPMTLFHFAAGMALLCWLLRNFMYDRLGLARYKKLRKIVAHYQPAGAGQSRLAKAAQG